MSIEDELLGIYTRPKGPLTPRQAEIVHLMSQGMGNKEIAAELGVSLQTIKNHVSAILSKLDAHDRAHAVAIYIRKTELPDIESFRAASREFVDTLNLISKSMTNQLVYLDERIERVSTEPPIVEPPPPPRKPSRIPEEMWEAVAAIPRSGHGPYEQDTG